MKKILAKAGLVLIALGAPALASAQNLEGKWANPKKSVIVNVARCGDAYCGTVSWATRQEPRQGRDARHPRAQRPQAAGRGRLQGQRFEPKRNIRGSATVHQVGDNVMIVKGCAVMGLFCKEQRWTRIS